MVQTKSFKWLLVMGVLMAPTALTAAGLPWLTFRMTDNSEISVAAENLTVNYENRILRLTSPSVSQEIPVDNVKSMQFTSSPSGVELIGTETESLKGDYYDISGAKEGSFSSFDEARGKLSSGVYIIKNGDNIHKIIL